MGRVSSHGLRICCRSMHCNSVQFCASVPACASCTFACNRAVGSAWRDSEKNKAKTVSCSHCRGLASRTMGRDGMVMFRPGVALFGLTPEASGQVDLVRWTTSVEVCGPASEHGEPTAHQTAVTWHAGRKASARLMAGLGLTLEIGRAHV